ncbi:MAG: hypothetical protein GC159_04050 [Phycisphaera sp.]|nr:hypothetical protein [Phycisphaera sp.]
MQDNNDTNIDLRFWTLCGMVMLTAMARLAPHPANVTPIAAMALFGGAYFGRRWLAFVVPLAAMYVSDVVLGHTVYAFGFYHSGLPAVYGAFAATTAIGVWLLRRERKAVTVALACVGSTLLFFVVTNLAVWLAGKLYPLTLDGLAMCYTAALPYLRNALLGDLAFTAMLFGGFEWATRRVPALREVTP